MTSFKQIIGRGTRIDEEHNKYYFTVMDFKKATELFRDPDFDGDPVQIYEPGPGEPIEPPDLPGGDDEDNESDDEGPIGEGGISTPPDISFDPEDEVEPRKYYVNNVAVSIAPCRYNRRIRHVRFVVVKVVVDGRIVADVI